MKNKRKKQEYNYCELCGDELKRFNKIQLKNNHVICSKYQIRYKRKGDPFNLMKMDIKTYAKRKEVEDGITDDIIEARAKKLFEEEKQKQKEIEERKARWDALPNEIILDDILLKGSRRADIQDTIDGCSQGEAVTIEWEKVKIEKILEVDGDRLIVIHDFSKKEIGRFSQSMQKKIERESQDYIFNGEIEKIGQRYDGSLFVIIKLIGEKKKST